MESNATRTCLIPRRYTTRRSCRQLRQKCSHGKSASTHAKHANTSDSDNDNSGKDTASEVKNDAKAEDKAAAGDDDADDKPKAKPDKAKKTKSSGKVASRANKTTEAYKQTLFVTEEADKEDMEAEDWIPKGHGKSWVIQTRLSKYVQVERLAIDGLAEVKREQQDGTWDEGMSYEVDGPDHSGMTTLEENDVLSKIAERQKHAHDKIAELKTELAKAFRKEFPKASKAQLAKLDKMGLPIEIAEQRAKLAAQFAKAELSAAVSEALTKSLRAAIRVYPKRVADDSLPIGTSRLGGLPDLAADTPWPRFGKVPMMFVGQLRLEELAPFDADRLLPKRGLLAFFLDENGYRGAKVLYFATTKDLVRTPAPDGMIDRPTATAALRFHTGFELPTDGTREARALGKEARDLELPGALELPRPATLTQVLGYDDYRGYDREPPKGTRPLFRCDSESQADLNFGDAQDIAFRIADVDLAAARFDRAVLWFQTG